MFVEAMLISGVGFSALVTVSGLGYFDQAAEATGLQQKGDLAKFQTNNEFTGAQLLETEDMIEDIKTDLDDMLGRGGDEDSDEEQGAGGKDEGAKRPLQPPPTDL